MNTCVIVNYAVSRNTSNMQPHEQLLFIAFIVIIIFCVYIIFLNAFVYLLHISQIYLVRAQQEANRPPRVRRFKRHPNRGPRTNKFQEYWEGEDARFVEAFRVSGFGLCM